MASTFLPALLLVGLLIKSSNESFSNILSGGKWKFLGFLSSLVSLELSAIRLCRVLRSSSCMINECGVLKKVLHHATDKSWLFQLHKQTYPDCPIKDLRDEFVMKTWHLTFICFFTHICRVRRGCWCHVLTAPNTCSVALVCLFPLSLAYRSINI